MPSVPGSIWKVLGDRMIVATSLGTSSTYTISAVSLKPGEEGTLLWSQNYTAPPGNLTLSLGAADLDTTIFTIRYKETRQLAAYSLETGDLQWGPTPSQGPWMLYYQNHYIAYGMVITSGSAVSGGEVHAYNATNGEEVWTYYSGSPNLETAYDNVP